MGKRAHGPVQAHTLDICMFKQVKRQQMEVLEIKKELEEAPPAKATAPPTPEATTAPEATPEATTAPETTEQAFAAEGSKVSMNKQSYNKFNYKLRMCSPKVKNIWKQRGKMSEQDMEAFMLTVLESAKGKVDEEYLQTLDISSQIEEGITEGGWVSWAQACTTEGEEQLLAMVKAQTVSTQRHPDIPESSNIEWPKYLQVKLIKKTTKSTLKTETSNTKAKKDSQNVVEKFDKIKGEFEQEMHKQEAQQKHNSPRPSASSSSSGHGQATEEQIKRDKLAMGNIRKCHGNWDRLKPTFLGAVAKSTKHENTSGCKFEKDLKELISEGDSKDMALMAMEAKYQEKGQLSTSEIKEGAKVVSELQEAIKKSTARATALQQRQNI